MTSECAPLGCEALAASAITSASAEFSFAPIYKSSIVSVCISKPFSNSRSRVKRRVNNKRSVAEQRADPHLPEDAENGHRVGAFDRCGEVRESRAVCHHMDLLAEGSTKTFGIRCQNAKNSRFAIGSDIRDTRPDVYMNTLISTSCGKCSIRLLVQRVRTLFRRGLF